MNDDSFLFSEPPYVIVGTSEVDDRGLYGAILRIPHPQNQNLMFVVFTDVDLAERAAKASSLKGVSFRKLATRELFADLVTQYVAKGGKYVAVNPVADGRSGWDIFDAVGFLGDLRKPLGA
jgi:hypothetical protein